MAAENFKVKKGLEVGTGSTITSGGINITGVVTATTFVGDGSGLTGVTGSGSGVVIKHDGSAIGTASTINFSTNLDVTAISAGVVTVTASTSGINNIVEDTTPQLGGNLDLDGKFINGTGGANITGVVTATTGDFVNLDVDGETDLDDLSVAGVSTFTGAIDANGNLDVDGQTDLDDVVVAGVSTFTGNIDANGNLDVDGQTDLDDVVVAGVSTFTGNIDANGNLDVDGQTDLDDVVVAGVSTFNDGITLGTNSTTFAAKFADDAVANFGTDNDLQISHDNSNALIRNSTGKIVVVGVVSATSGANITGVVTATTFSGSGASLTSLPSGQLSGALPALDGSALTGVTASGSGVVVKHDGSTVGTAGTINFSTNLDVTAVSAGIVTITASGGASNASTFTVTANNTADETVYPIFVDGATGSQGAESDTNLSYNPNSNILTAGTFSGNLAGTVNTAAQTNITSLGTLSSLTVSGNITANGNVVGDNSTNISGIASVTATSFHGSGALITSLDADNLGSGTIPNGRFPATLPATSGVNLTALNASEITSGTLPIARIEDAAVTFAKMQHVGTGVFIGRDTSGTGDIETLTAAEARTLLNVADGATAGITTASTNVVVTWDVVNNSGSSYRFTGPGNDGVEDNPDIYLVRGQKYRFAVNASTHPFYIKTVAGTGTGNQYTDGVTGNGAQTGNVEFNVQHDAPASLFYQCSAHGAMVGNIYIVGQHLANGANNRVLTATSAYGINAESNMTFDGDDLTISHDGLAVNIFESNDNHSRLRIRSGSSSLAQLEFSDQEDADAGEIRYDHANEKMTFHVGSNTERVGISSSGDINVTGVTTFSGFTHIKTAVINTAYQTIESTATNSYPYLRLKNDAREYQLSCHGGQSDSFNIYDGTAAAYRFTIKSDGNVLITNKLGIGDRTTSPDEDLHVHTSSGQANIHVEGATDGQIILRAHNGDSVIHLGDASATSVGKIVYDHGTDSLQFNTNSNPRLSITSAGLVSIGDAMNGMNMGFGNQLLSSKSDTYSAGIFGSNGSALTALIVYADHASFAANMQDWRTVRSNNSAFNFLRCSSNSATDNEFFIGGDGVVYSDGGTTMQSPADYAEMFEWSDGNSSDEDRRGYTVVLDGNKVRIATSSDSTDNIIGVVSGNPAVLADNAWDRWAEKYQKDDYNCYVRNSDGDRILNSSYDDTQTYVPREDRKEWDAIGMVGKLRVRKGQKTGTRWLKMRNVSDTVEEWLVR